MKRVVHVLANDGVASWLIYFLETFREHNPDAPVVIIPYSNDVQRVQEIGSAYQCAMAQYDFSRIDEFANSYFDDKKKIGRLRKLAAFDSTAEVSVYIDIDSIVTGSFEFSIPPNSRINLVFGTKSGDSVYRAKPSSQMLWAKSQFFSSGLLILNNPSEWTSANKILEFITENRQEYMDIRAPFVIDQPLLNYYIDKSNRKAVPVSDLWADISPHNWYNDPTLNITPEGVRDKYGRKVLFIHWAGEDKNSQAPLRFTELRERISKRIRLRCGSLANDLI